jgi:ATP-binding cassette subfamily F protein uup
MNLLSINNLSKAYGAKVLFNKISFGINYGEKVALVAKTVPVKQPFLKF